MNDRSKVCDKAVYLHVHIGFRAIILVCEEYKIICRRRTDQPECETLCVVQMHATCPHCCWSGHSCRCAFLFSALSFHVDSFSSINP